MTVILLLAALVPPLGLLAVAVGSAVHAAHARAAARPDRPAGGTHTGDHAG